MKDLMKPRVIVTAPYPGCPWEIGDVLERRPDTPFYWDKNDGYAIHEKDVQLCSANFKTLAWHENRELGELPEYVKLCGESCLFSERNGFDYPYVFKIARWGVYDDGPEYTNNGQIYAIPENYKASYNGETRMIVTHFEPATLTDYEQFKNGK